MASDKSLENKQSNFKARNWPAAIVGAGLGSIVTGYYKIHDYVFRQFETSGKFSHLDEKRAEQFKKASDKQVKEMLRHNWYDGDGGINLPKFVDNINAEYQAAGKKIIAEHGVHDIETHWKELTHSNKKKVALFATGVGLMVGAMASTLGTKSHQDEKHKENTIGR